MDANRAKPTAEQLPTANNFLEVGREFDIAGRSQKALAVFKQAHAAGQLHAPSARQFVAALAVALGDHRFARQLLGGQQSRRFLKVWIAIGVALLLAVWATAIRAPQVYCAVPGLSVFCTPQTFIFQVRVTDQTTGAPIAHAAVSLTVGGQAPYRTVTDSEGVAVFELLEEYNARPGLITMGIEGYKTSIVNITIQADNMPLIVQLQPIP